MRLMSMPLVPWRAVLSITAVLEFFTTALHAQQRPAPRQPAALPPGPAVAAATAAPDSLASALSAPVWKQVEDSIERALAWLASEQLADGSIKGPTGAQPAATSLSIMAWISKGHVPGEGPYGEVLEKAIDFVLECQQSNGLLASGGSSMDGKAANYNHAISGLMLTEVYGMTDRLRQSKLKPAIINALKFTREIQLEPKNYPEARGGWKYLYGYQDSGESDLSVTSWQLMFLRSARNAEFEVPKQFVDDAVGFVTRCWDENQGVFYYQKSGGQVRYSRGMVGAGILSLALSGQHDTRIAQRAGDWLLVHPFQGFGDTYGSGDRFFYSVYYCSQAMAQLGGRHWKQFFPNMVEVLLSGQSSSGEWPSEPNRDSMYGNTYTTALAVLSLTPPLQLLPVYQR